ncbi:hypothetical protein HMPREF0454_02443 [Hafnia alvei ATCC 51873]|uniref:Uncharacterized protein n=1 Tax=Hafnia alvei ATCC 51873 TaxID=1002364 RepID=G9Y770_HAFAL|nr:hypothetical protein HMPREF0454_02443 [Hafnia alvei ATCC 51873]
MKHFINAVFCFYRPQGRARIPIADAKNKINLRPLSIRCDFTLFFEFL